MGQATGKRTSLPARITAAAALLVVGLGLWTLVIEPQLITVTHTRIPIENLPPELEGLRIALVSDTHHGPWTGERFVRRAARLAGAERPDIVALTGDYVHHDVRYADPGVAPLGSIDAPLGTFAVLGNHDHWEGADAVRGALEKHGIILLENDHRIVERSGARICIAGMEEIWEGTPDMDKALSDMDKALSDVDPAIPRIVLVHNPDFVQILGEEPRVDLVLAGHTHGGQVVLPFVGPLIVPASKKYAAGLVETDHALLYVTRGLSEITPPVRFACRPEIAILELVRAKD